ncbi:hypothetical protein HY480_02220 [Candidatus Uhrbacteria bacterium]|nr:hypothetical protein [Candidatus Uhrbacteria bacterium]
MSIPFWSMLVPYTLYLVLFGVLAAVDVYHMVRFGTFGMVNFLALFLFLAGIALILWWTAIALVGIDWLQPIGNVVPGIFGGSDSISLSLAAVSLQLP